MRIVVLDGFTLNPGDLSWERLAALGELTVYDRTPADRIQSRAEGAEILLTNKTPLSAEIIAALPQLEYIGVLATGYNVVALETCRQRGIVVTNVPGYSTDSAAQMAFALLLEHCQRVGAHSEAVLAGHWSRSDDFCFWLHPLTELAGLTMGIIGMGQIGQKVGVIAQAFGMHVMAHSRTQPEPPPLPNMSWGSLEAVLGQADVVSLHCPLTEATEGLMSRERLRLMKPTSFLINTARGGLLVDADVADALNTGAIAGAGLDVLSAYEPPAADNPLLSAKNVIITPHIAWAAKASRERLMKMAVANVAAFLNGQPTHAV